METPCTPFTPSPDNPEVSLSVPVSPMVKPLRPLVYNFFVDEHPATLQQTIEDLQINNYKSFHSQRIQSGGPNIFRPTIQSKKLIDDPKFLLSVQRKKMKIMKGINQKASSQRPSRSSYTGRKLRNTVKTAHQEQLVDTHDFEVKETPIIAMDPGPIPIRKTKQPHLHFNLRLVLKSRKTFTGDFSRQENITGSSFPYYHYFSSSKCQAMPNQKTNRYRTPRKSSEAAVKAPKTSQGKRFMSKTVGVRTRPFCQQFN